MEGSIGGGGGGEAVNEGLVAGIGGGGVTVSPAVELLME